ncbi:hypothetical protein F441_20619 [Phytophthora nicotianae CJ01A1]|uniref:Uncharacterized protein n=6 Tax=Phytophthora nicotianae TaxID=4792 RepID=W2QVI8_PHYN3|nr:hypothetical protein PPTG_21807 [Phytophthora nicotianae INRA-310]ETI32456.1 hypothetical protein F443_20747 [Phytophthora nicotianae P1569]ETL79492.1 hypothetical protein L917_19897 [Phytophthora nicotianae]ETO61197.1 hypothetical protein F444_20762 [Phytophthora nicotianae P1976]ETP02294.1 hypothetical protein F441_20619 [Phytophthora nicotianae CJ01A1]ETP30478.1 hypothetical protein F442_20546 [Phytophthora nicotianae P10297]
MMIPIQNAKGIRVRRQSSTAAPGTPCSPRTPTWTRYGGI